MNNKRPPKCCYPNCFECPYVDCRYDRLEAEDYTETNNRDYFLHENSTGYKLHKPTDKEYKAKRHIAYQRKNRKYVNQHEYNQLYYKENADKIKEKKKANYDRKTNTIKCRKYRKRHKEERKQYDKEYYEKNKERLKKQALERYYRNKAT